MRPTQPQPAPVPNGYSMIELVVVVGLIVVMAAIAVPNIAGYTRNYRVRGATQKIAGEIQTARNKAIVKNTNFGVAFAVLDNNTYRYFVLDDNVPPVVPTAGLGPLQDLPQGVAFVPAAQPGIGFDRLGRACRYGASGCVITAAPTVATLCPTPGELARCTDRPAGNFIEFRADNSLRVTVLEEQTQQQRWVEVAPGGRVMSQR